MQRRTQIILIVVLLLVLAGLAVAGYFVYQQMTKQTQTVVVSEEQQKEEGAVTLEQEVASKEIIEKNAQFSFNSVQAIIKGDVNLCYELVDKVNQDICADNYYLQAAKSSKDAKNCQNVVNSNPKDQCYYDLALNTNDSTFCDNIIDAVKKDNCLQNLLILKASDSLDIGICLETKDLFQLNCIDNILFKTRDIGLCNDLTDSAKDYCLYKEMTIEAKASGNISLCDTIEKVSDRAVCREEYSQIGDADSDGLNDYDEIFYGTDVNNPDTDGDGFKDGEEVEKGYNPLGSGKL